MHSTGQAVDSFGGYVFVEKILCLLHSSMSRIIKFMIKEITASRFFAESLGVYFPYSENESCLHLLYDFGEINSPSYIVFIVLNLRYFPRKFCLVY